MHYMHMRESIFGKQPSNRAPLDLTFVSPFKILFTPQILITPTLYKMICQFQIFNYNRIKVAGIPKTAVHAIIEFF